MNPDLVEDVRLVLFTVGDTVYGADASQVVRIDQPHEGGAGGGSSGELVKPELGSLIRGDRVLVFRQDGGEGQLKVDSVQGLKQVAVDQLRRIPTASLAASYALGFWLDGDRPVLLIDLSESLKGGR